MPKDIQYVTQNDIATYRKDGVVCLRGVFDRHWIATLWDSWERLKGMRLRGENVYAAVEPMLEDDPLLQTEMAYLTSRETKDQKANAGSGAKWTYLWDEGMRSFVHDSPAAQIVGEVLEADQVRFFWDQTFVKLAGAGSPTYWHTDMPAWPVQGTHLPSLWMPLTPIDMNLNSLGYIPGSHKTYDSTDWPRGLNAVNLNMPKGRHPFKDIEALKAKRELDVITFDMEPGDAVLFDPRLYHGGGANNHPTQDRVALSTRWVGTDVTWDPRPECSNVPGMPQHKMVAGSAIDDDKLFPVIWAKADRVAA